ncbi:MAG: hypothetical protein AB1765_09120 [Candidatus Hydrogenedentota bacterium]
MERICNKFYSFKEAEKNEQQYALSLTPGQRVMIARELMAQIHGDLSNLPDIREYERNRKKQ